MANTPAMCNSFKNELLTGQHNLGVGFIRAATTVDTIKAALYLTTAAITKATTAYSSTNELTNGSGTGYTAGGANVTNAAAPLLYTDTATWTPSAPIVWNALTSSAAFDTVFLYNSTNGNKGIASYGIGSQTITAGTLTLTMPTPAAGTALINIA
jgi:hypothetical protein